MRSLQRLRHVNLPSAQEAQRIQTAERRKTARKERSIWLLRLQWIARAGTLLLLVLALLHWVFGDRTVIEGLVEANLVVVRAPDRVRVRDVLCRAGQRIEAGTPLVRLESLAPPEERRGLELALEESRLRLSLVRAGGDLGDTDIARRADRVAQADRDALAAENAVRLAEVDLETALRQRVAFELALREEQAQKNGQVAALGARAEEARALLAKAMAENGFQNWDAQSRLELNVAGIVSDRDVASALAARGAGQGAIDGLNAATRALDRELEAARAALDLSRGHVAAKLAELDSAVAAARTRVEAAGAERDSWRELARRQRELGATAALGEGAKLRELELALLENRVDSAQAQLARYDRTHGQTVLTAPTSGIVERVFFAPGAVVEADEVLVRSYDPALSHVVAYLERAQGDPPTIGAECAVIPVGTSRTLRARVRGVDAVWTPCPAILPQRHESAADMRLPLHVEFNDPQALLELEPNQRVRVILREREPEGESEYAFGGL